MDEQILENILKSKDKKIYGNVVRNLGGGSYKVVDSSNGGIIIVDSNVIWNPGAGVSIKDGVIIGTSSNTIVRKTYQV